MQTVNATKSHLQFYILGYRQNIIVAIIVKTVFDMSNEQILLTIADDHLLALVRHCLTALCKGGLDFDGTKVREIVERRENQNAYKVNDRKQSRMRKCSVWYGEVLIRNQHFDQIRIILEIAGLTDLSTV